MVTQASTLTSAIEDARKAKVAQGKIDEANACLEKLEGQGKAAEVCLKCAIASHRTVLDCRSTLVCLGKRKRKRKAQMPAVTESSQRQHVVHGTSLVPVPPSVCIGCAGDAL